MLGDLLSVLSGTAGHPDSELGMRLQITLTAIVELPDAAELHGERTIQLGPDSREWLKPWIVLERNDLMDCTEEELENLAVHLEHDECSIEVLDDSK